MSAGFTPGPWRLAENDATLVVTEALDADGNCAVVADVLHVTGPASEADFADARLIAAAPELLDACKRMVAATEADQHYIGEEHAFMLEAIAKAEGR